MQFCLQINCLETFEKDIYRKLQKSCHMLQSGAATCNGLKKFHAIVAESRAEFHFVQLTVVSSKGLREKLQRGHVTRYNLLATCLATPLPNELQRRLHRVTLAIELDSTSCNEFRDFFETIANCSPRLQRVTCLLQLAMDFSNVARQLTRKIASCNTSFN